MNGRAYDYSTGRFLSVDPLIHLDAGSQGINPYSYIFNNPLSGTDPTGYDPVLDETEKNIEEKTFIYEYSVAGSRIKRKGKGAVVTGGGKTAVVTSSVHGGFSATVTKNGDKNSDGSATSASMTAAKTGKAEETQGPEVGGASTSENQKSDVSFTPVVAGAAASSAANVTEEAKELQKKGKFQHSDGSVKKSGFHGNQHAGYTAEEVAKSKKVQMRKALTNKAMGPLGVVVTGYAVLDDVAAHQEGAISTERLGYRTTGNIAPWGIAVFSPWGAVAVGVGFPVTEHFYNEASQGVNNARQKENINSFSDFNKSFLNHFTGANF